MLRANAANRLQRHTTLTHHLDLLASSSTGLTPARSVILEPFFDGFSRYKDRAAGNSRRAAGNSRRAAGNSRRAAGNSRRAAGLRMGVLVPVGEPLEALVQTH